MNLFRLLVWAWLLTTGVGVADAALSVKADEPKLIGTKAVIKLSILNTFTQKVESARAVAFLLDNSGKVVGQSAQWVIGGSKERPSLEPNKEAIFNFVIPFDKAPISGATNTLKAKITFIRVILEGGKLVDTAKDVQIQSAGNDPPNVRNH